MSTRTTTLEIAAEASIFAAPRRTCVASAPTSKMLPALKSEALPAVALVAYSWFVARPSRPCWTSPLSSVAPVVTPVTSVSAVSRSRLKNWPASPPP